MSKQDRLAVVLTYTYPPDPAVSSPRISHLVAALRARGFRVLVVTAAAPKGGDQADVLLISDPLSRIRQWFTKPRTKNRSTTANQASTPSDKTSSASRVLFAIRHTLIPNIALVDRQIFWAWKVRCTLPRRLKLLEPPLFVLASVPPFSLLSVARRLANAWGSPVFFDVRDLWLPPTASTGPTARFWRSFVHSSLRRRFKGVELVTTVSPSLKRTIHDSLEQPSSVIENGVDSREWAGVRGVNFGRGHHLIYTGKLYPEYEFHLLMLLESLATQESGPGWILHYFGPDFRYLNRLATSVAAQEYIRECGTVEATESHRAQLGASALLLLSGGIDGPITTKVYDYVASGRPIICVGSKENDAAALLNLRAQVWRICNSPAEIAETLDDFRGHNPLTAGTQIPQAMLREFQSQKWVSLIENALEL